MSMHNKTCRVCMNRDIQKGVGKSDSSYCEEFKRGIKRDKPRCSTRFLERKPVEKELDIVT